MKQIDIEGWEQYQITDDGRVWSKRNNKWLKTSIGSHGYLMVTFSSNGKGKKYLLHRLIAEAFLPNEENKPCIDHINGDRTDNRIENLRWCTYKENNNNPVYINRKVGQKRSEEARKKMSLWQIGKTHSEETKRKMSEAHRKKKDK